MNQLPSSIEAYLVEAGFAQTEILILKNLLSTDAMTVRELAGKTGKSTGVLDQAIKKLVRKQIVSREVINEIPKYALRSLRAIVDWMEDDMTAKRDMLLRRHQNFETFVASLNIDRSRPEFGYFEGEDGMKRAYSKMLHVRDEAKEMLCFFPATYKEEEDPFRDFRVQFYRERKNRNIALRVIAHDVSMGRRYQSRDIFESRKTILVPPDQYPIRFEMLIVGNTVACFNHASKKACILQYPELAETERLMFEAAWARFEKGIPSVMVEVSGAPNTPSRLASEPNASVGFLPMSKENTPFRTRLRSALRQLFLTPRSLLILGAFALIAAGATALLHWQIYHLNLSRLQERAKSIAITAAPQFDARDLDALRVESDWKKPEWAKVVNLLKSIRERNEDITFTYIVRKRPGDDKHFEFIADSHSLNPYANSDNDPNNDVDANGDGKIDPEGTDLLQWPGQYYDDSSSAIFDAFNSPSVDGPYRDQWGTVLTGLAPIYRLDGEVAGVIGIDIFASRLQDLTKQVISPVKLFLFLLITFVFLRFIFVYPALAKEIICDRRFLFSFGVAALMSAGLTYWFWQHNVYLNTQRIREKAISIAATGSTQFDAVDLNELRTKEDIKKPIYAKVIEILNRIRNQNPDVKYIYILRPTPPSYF